MSPPTSLKRSFAYRQRLRITAFSLIVCWIAAIFTAPWIREHTLLDHVLDGVGWFLLLCGITLRGWSSHQISGQKKTTIVTTGPYALCRNPLYWGTFLIAISQLAFVKTMLFGLGVLVPVAVYVYGVVPAEEEFLSASFGAIYQDYCAHTSRWWPHWNSSALQSSPVAARAIFRREVVSLVMWLFLPAIAELICYLRELPAWPHSPYLI